MKEELTPWTPSLRIRAISDENMMGTREVGVRKCASSTRLLLFTPRGGGG